MSERMWCTACGTVTADNICDCNRWHNEMSREPHFVNYADAMQEAAHEQAQRVDILEKVLERLLKTIDSGTWRDRTELSIAAHPAVDDARAILADVRTPPTREGK